MGGGGGGGGTAILCLRQSDTAEFLIFGWQYRDLV